MYGSRFVKNAPTANSCIAKFPIQMVATARFRELQTSSGTRKKKRRFWKNDKPVWSMSDDWFFQDITTVDIHREYGKLLLFDVSNLDPSIYPFLRKNFIPVKSGHCEWEEVFKCQKNWKEKPGEITAKDIKNRKNNNSKDEHAIAK